MRALKLECIFVSVAAALVVLAFASNAVATQYGAAAATGYGVAALAVMFAGLVALLRVDSVAGAVVAALLLANAVLTALAQLGLRVPFLYVGVPTRLPLSLPAEALASAVPALVVLLVVLRRRSHESSPSSTISHP